MAFPPIHQEGLPIRCMEEGNYNGLTIGYEGESFPQKEGAFVELAYGKQTHHYSSQNYKIIEVIREDGPGGFFKLKKVHLPVLRGEEYFFPTVMQVRIEHNLSLSITTPDLVTLFFVCME